MQDLKSPSNSLSKKLDIWGICSSSHTLGSGEWLFSHKPCTALCLAVSASQVYPMTSSEHAFIQKSPSPGQNPSLKTDKDITACHGLLGKGFCAETAQHSKRLGCPDSWVLLSALPLALSVTGFGSLCLCTPLFSSCL